MKIGIVYDFIDNPDNFIHKLEAILKRNRPRTISHYTSPPPPPVDDPVDPAPSPTTVMAKSLHDYSIPNVANVPTGPTIDIGVRNFDLRTGLITMV